MGAWGLGRDGALLDAAAATEARATPAAPKAPAQPGAAAPPVPPGPPAPVDGAPREEPPAQNPTMSDLAGKVLAWIPGEVVVIYGALITLFVGSDSETLGASGSIILTLLGFVLAGGLVVLAAWSSTSGPGWMTQRIKGRAALACAAFVIWSLTVPDSGWQEIDWIADHPAETAALAGVIGLIFSLIATGADNRWGKQPS